jgi:hypothetical protein
MGQFPVQTDEVTLIAGQKRCCMPDSKLQNGLIRDTCGWSPNRYIPACDLLGDPSIDALV